MLGNYLKMAWKVLRRRRFFTFVSLFGIGFTLTVVMTLAALLDADLAPGYPETRLDRMLIVERMGMYGDRNQWTSSVGHRLLDEYMRDLPGVETMTIFSGDQPAISFVDGRKISSDARFTDADYWRVMEFEFLEGSAYTANDDEQGRLVTVISESTRRRFFAGREAVGRTLRLNHREFRVVGVVRDVPWYRSSTHADLWAPIGAMRDQSVRDDLIGRFRGAFLLAPGTDSREVQAAFLERLTRVELPDPERYHTLAALPMTRLQRLSNMILNLGVDETAPERLLLIVMLGTLAFMALPAINLVSINLSRIYERMGEIGVRKAFGASGRDLVGQFVVENIVLCLVGGVVGLIGAFVALQVLANLPQIPYMEVRFSPRFFVIALALALVFGLISGVGPAWRMSRQPVVAALRGGRS